MGNRNMRRSVNNFRILHRPNIRAIRKVDWILKILLGEGKYVSTTYPEILVARFV